MTANADMAFSFFMNTTINFGREARFQIKDVLAKENWDRVGVIVDHNICDLEIIKNFLSELENSVQELVVGRCRISEPTYISLEEVRKDFCKPGLKAVIGIGGGSALDMAKAMAVLVNNPKPALEYRGFDMMTEPVLPIIAVPTTAGTGSEVTPNASFIDSEAKKKLGINGEAVRPRYAFLDPELTLSAPKAATVSAGADSIVHAVEAFVAKKTNPMARFFAAQGFKTVIKNLPPLVDDLGNIDLRSKVMFGAFLAGIALMHSGTGPAAALSYPLGVHYKVPHGLGGGLFLTHVIEHNIKGGFYEYAGLLSEEEPWDAAAAGSFLEKLTSAWEKLDMPIDLGFCGLDQSGVDSFVSETMELKGALDQNPTPFGEDEIRLILNKLIKA